MTSRADAELPFHIRREHAVPYLTTLEFTTIDQQRYDALSATLTSSGPSSGILFHSCAAVPHGWRITDLWERATAFERFVAASLLPATRALGWPEPSRRECIATYPTGMVQRWMKNRSLKKTTFGCRFGWARND